MFCPNCKIEYRPGFTQCSDCGANLVAALEPAADVADQGLALAWRGMDPAGFSAAQAALDGAGIRNFPMADHDQLAWDLAIPKPRYSILVQKSDLAAALELVATIQECSPLATVRDIWKSTPLFSRPKPLPGSEDMQAREEETAEDVPDDILEKIRPADATATAWSGDASMLDILDACLRENGIASIKVDQGKSGSILVTPQREARAKEIIREVIEATPPE